MPRGGSRPGSGPKPRGRNVLGFTPGRSSAPPPGPPPPPDADITALREPPSDLPTSIDIPGLGRIPAPHDFWRQWAPHAIEQRTLVPATAAGFRELCELASLKDEVYARLRKHGSDGKPGRERVSNYTKLSQRVDAALARFKLTAMGRPADAGKKQPAANNPWSTTG